MDRGRTDDQGADRCKRIAPPPDDEQQRDATEDGAREVVSVQVVIDEMGDRLEMPGVFDRREGVLQMGSGTKTIDGEEDDVVGRGVEDPPGGVVPHTWHE